MWLSLNIRAKLIWPLNVNNRAVFHTISVALRISENILHTRAVALYQISSWLQFIYASSNLIMINVLRDSWKNSWFFKSSTTQSLRCLSLDDLLSKCAIMIVKAPPVPELMLPKLYTTPHVITSNPTRSAKKNLWPRRGTLYSQKRAKGALGKLVQLIAFLPLKVHPRGKGLQPPQRVGHYHSLKNGR